MMLRIKGIGLLVLLFIMSMVARGQPTLTPVFYINGQFPRECGQFTTQKGWQLTTFADTSLKEAIDRLDQCKVLIYGSLAGYEKNLPYAEYADKLRKFIEKGGVVIILDANYNSAMGLIEPLGDDFKLKRNTNCIMRKKDIIRSSKVLKGKSEGAIPYDLNAVFKEYHDGWSHFEGYTATGFKTLAQCPDGGGTLIGKFVGEGMVVAATYSAMVVTERQEMVEKLAANMLAAVNLKRNQLKMQGLNVNARFKETYVQVQSSKPLLLKVWCDEELILSQELSAKNSRVPFDTATGGMLLVELFDQNEFIAAKHIELAAPLQLKPSKYSYNPKNAKSALILSYLNIADQDQYQIAFRVNGESVTPRELKSGYWQFDFSNLPGETIKIDADLVAKDTGEIIFSADAVEVTQKKELPKSGVDAAGNFYVDGKDQFILGMYHVSKDHRLSLAMRDEALEFCAKNGYNLLHPSRKNDESDSSFIGFLDKAQAAGVMILPEMDYLFGVIDRYSFHPAIVGYDTGDEPDLNGTTSEAYQDILQKLAQHDDKKVGYTCFMEADSLNRYWPVSELLATDPYPVPRTKLDLVYRRINKLVKATEGGGIGVIAVLQGFGYENDDTFRLPRPEQIRNMTYQALVAGAKGIIYYTYQDGRFYLPDAKKFMEMMIRLPAEIKPLEKYLLYGQREEIGNLPAGVYGARWILDQQTLELIVDTNTCAVKSSIK